MIDRTKIPQHIIDEYLAAEKEFKDAKKALSVAIIAASSVNKGDVLRDTDTGATYRVEKAHGWFVSRRSQIGFDCRRVYSTGRSPATTTTWITSFSNIENLGPYEDWKKK